MSNQFYYLTYQLFPTQEQVRKAYPNIDAVFVMKRHYDEIETFHQQVLWIKDPVARVGSAHNVWGQV